MPRKSKQVRLAGPGVARTEAEVALRQSVAQMQALTDEVLDYVTSARAALWAGDAEGTFDHIGLAQAALAELNGIVVIEQVVA